MQISQQHHGVRRILMEAYACVTGIVNAIEDELGNEGTALLVSPQITNGGRNAVMVQFDNLQMRVLNRPKAWALSSERQQARR